jgi:parallel beta-helix repeat protein
MYISADNVILDCQGHLIDGDVACGNSFDGIHADNLGGIIIKNCILTDWCAGVNLEVTSNINLQNLTISSVDRGITLLSSKFNTLTDINIFNASVGLIISDYTNVINFTANVTKLPISYGSINCHSYFENVIGADNKPIVFFNSTVEIRGWNNNVSEIILCGADNSIIDSLSIINSYRSGGLELAGSNNVTITNSYFENVYYIDFYFTSNSVISDTKLISPYLGVILGGPSNNNILNNITILDCNYGFYFAPGSSSNNIISNSKVQNCSIYGIYLRRGPTNNLIYNNLFNNTNNFYFYGTVYPNNWNTTRQPGTRIYSFGNEIGGNYWTNPDGNG